jgi:hypothetical protein
MASIPEAGKSAATALMGAVGTGVAYVNKRTNRVIGGRRDAYSVVINRPREELETGLGTYAGPLTSLASHARLDLAAGPGGRGTVVRARTDDANVDVRAELRSAKQLLETGQVLRADAWPANRGPAAQKITGVVDRLLSKGGGR